MAPTSWRYVDVPNIVPLLPTPGFVYPKRSWSSRDRLAILSSEEQVQEVNDAFQTMLGHRSIYEIDHALALLFEAIPSVYEEIGDNPSTMIQLSQVYHRCCQRFEWSHDFPIELAFKLMSSLRWARILYIKLSHIKQIPAQELKEASSSMLAKAIDRLTGDAVHEQPDEVWQDQDPHDVEYTVQLLVTGKSAEWPDTDAEDNADADADHLATTSHLGLGNNPSPHFAHRSKEHLAHKMPTYVGWGHPDLDRDNFRYQELDDSEVDATYEPSSALRPRRRNSPRKRVSTEPSIRHRVKKRRGSGRRVHFDEDINDAEEGSGPEQSSNETSGSEKISSQQSVTQDDSVPFRRNPARGVRAITAQNPETKKRARAARAARPTIVAQSCPTVMQSNIRTRSQRKQLRALLPGTPEVDAFDMAEDTGRMQSVVPDNSPCMDKAARYQRKGLDRDLEHIEREKEEDTSDDDTTRKTSPISSKPKSSSHTTSHSSEEQEKKHALHPQIATDEPASPRKEARIGRYSVRRRLFDLTKPISAYRRQADESQSPNTSVSPEAGTKFDRSANTNSNRIDSKSGSQSITSTFTSKNARLERKRSASNRTGTGLSQYEGDGDYREDERISKPKRLLRPRLVSHKSESKVTGRPPIQANSQKSGPKPNKRGSTKKKMNTSQPKEQGRPESPYSTSRFFFDSSFRTTHSDNGDVVEDGQGGSKVGVTSATISSLEGALNGRQLKSRGDSTLGSRPMFDKRDSTIQNKHQPTPNLQIRKQDEGNDVDILRDISSKRELERGEGGGGCSKGIPEYRNTLSGYAQYQQPSSVNPSFSLTPNAPSVDQTTPQAARRTRYWDPARDISIQLNLGRPRDSGAETHAIISAQQSQYRLGGIPGSRIPGSDVSSHAPTPTRHRHGHQMNDFEGYPAGPTHPRGNLEGSQRRSAEDQPRFDTDAAIVSSGHEFLPQPTYQYRLPPWHKPYQITPPAEMYSNISKPQTSHTTLLPKNPPFPGAKDPRTTNVNPVNPQQISSATSSHTEFARSGYMGGKPQNKSSIWSKPSARSEPSGAPHTYINAVGPSEPSFSPGCVDREKSSFPTVPPQHPQRTQPQVKASAKSSVDPSPRINAMNMMHHHQAVEWQRQGEEYSVGQGKSIPSKTARESTSGIQHNTVLSSYWKVLPTPPLIGRAGWYTPTRPKVQPLSPEKEDGPG